MMSKKFLYACIVGVALSIIVFLTTGSYSLLKEQIFKYLTKGSTYKLTLHVESVTSPVKPLSGIPVQFLKVEVFKENKKKPGKKLKKIIAKKTNKNGIVTFLLPQGTYILKPSRGSVIQGPQRIILEKDIETKIILWFAIQ